LFDQLPSEFVQLRDSVLRFVDEVVEPHAQQIEQDNEIPQPVLDEAAKLGLFGLSIPEAYGGFGESEIASCVMLEALSRGPGGVTFFIAPTAPAAALRFAGTEEQRAGASSRPSA
jgi:acyl-CoA dehydrogenase